LAERLRLEERPLERPLELPGVLLLAAQLLEKLVLLARWQLVLSDGQALLVAWQMA
jgi:hypothetical protein